MPRTGKLELISRRMEQKELLRSAPSCLQGRLSLRVRNEIIERTFYFYSLASCHPPACPVSLCFPASVSCLGNCISSQAACRVVAALEDMAGSELFTHSIVLLAPLLPDLSVPKRYWREVAVYIKQNAQTSVAVVSGAASGAVWV